MPLSLRYQFWCWRKFMHEPEIRLASRLAIPNTLCLDVGANAGAYSFFMARAGGTVHAFEPIPELADALTKRFGSKVNVHRNGISERPGRAEIRAPIIDGRAAYGLASVEQEWGTVEVVRHTIDIQTIDSFNFSNVSLIKIDIEGHEAAALRGATSTIGRSRPSLIIEAEERHRPGAVGDVWEQLKALDYSGSFLLERRLHDISEFSVSRHQREFGDPNYVFNFVFFPREKAGEFFERSRFHPHT